MALAICNHVDGLTAGQEFVARLPLDFVVKNQNAFAAGAETCPHYDFVVVARRSFIPAAGFGNHNVQPVLLLHVAVGKSKLAAKIRASNFKPHQVVGVIDNPHLVRFSITDAKLSARPVGREFSHNFYP